MFEIQLFGRIEVRTRGVRLSDGDFGGDRPRHLLALLALRGGRPATELAELLRTSTTVVERDLAVLRARLEPGVVARESVIVGHRGRFTLNPDRVRVDVARFDELITLAAGRPADRAVKLLAAAAFLAARPLLADEDEPWAAEARAEYRAKLVMARLADVTQV
jgi:hypothetical protein